MADEKRNHIVLILGAKGYGKTWFARKLARRMAGEKKHILILDPMLSYSDSEYGVWTETDLENFLNGRRNREAIITSSEENLGQVLEWLAGLVPQVNLNLVLVIDEANMFTTSHTIHPALKRLVAFGRHSRLDMIFVVRDATELSPRIRSQADAIVSFRINRRRELDWCRGEAEREEDVERLRRLPPYEWAVLTATPSFRALIRIKKS